MHPFKRVIKCAQIPSHAVATALRAVIEEELERIKRLKEAAPKIYFNLALFVCAVVIKCANEDIGDSNYEHISGSTNHAVAFVRSTPCAFAQRMC